MSDGGSIVNFVPAVRDGETTPVEVVVSGDSVEIGGWAFSREDLLFALGAKEGAGGEQRAGGGQGDAPATP